MRVLKNFISILISVCIFASVACVASVYASAYADLNTAVKNAGLEESSLNTYYFYMPDSWKDENPYGLGVYFWGSSLCDRPLWPGYEVTEKTNYDSNIYVAKVPNDVTGIIWDSILKPRYQTVDVSTEWYAPSEDGYGFYPNGTRNLNGDSFNGMIYVIDPSATACSGVWFFYYGDGTYSYYPTKAEAIANNAVYSGGEFPTPVSNNTTSPRDFKYSVLNNGTAEITKYTGKASELEIPTTLDGYTVTSIREEAFYECESLTNVTIPKSVTSIGRSAFNGCSSLISVVIPDSITLIPTWAFANCESLKSVIIPDSVKSIGKAAFICCSNLKSIVIPDSVTVIYDSAFSSTGLTSITIPRNVTRIEDYAFGYDYWYDYSSNRGGWEKVNDFTISGYSGTVAETYANKNGFMFTSVSNPTEPMPTEAKTTVTLLSYSTVLMEGYTSQTLVSVNNPKGVTTYTSSNTSVATISSSGFLTAVSPGTTQITVTNNGVSAKFTLQVTEKPKTPATVTKKTQKITAKSSYTKTCDNKAFLLNAKTNGNGRLSYTSSDKKVATVSSKGKVTIKGSGKTTITVKAAASSKYKSASKKITVKVKPGKIKITSAKPSYKKLKLKFKQQKNCSGYESQFSEYKNFRKSVKTTYSLSTKGLIISVSETNKLHYFRIRAYKRINGKKVYGKWTKVTFRV